MKSHYNSPPAAFPLALGALAPKLARPLAADAPAPQLSLSIDNIDISFHQLAAYRRLCGFEAGKTAPVPYLFVLAFKAQAALLIQRRFPLRALGMVHIRCQLECFKAPKAGDVLTVEVALHSWRQVRRGREVVVDCKFLRGGEEIAHGIQTSLSLGGGSGAPAAPRTATSAPDGESEYWRLGPDTGRQYASVSGDYNPIHLTPWTSKWLGFKRPIAHGMYLVSRAIASLEASGDAAGNSLDARFKTPAQLPGEVRCFVGETDSGGRHDFEIWRGDGSRPHVAGSYGPLC